VVPLAVPSPVKFLLVVLVEAQLMARWWVPLWVPMKDVRALAHAGDAPAITAIAVMTDIQAVIITKTPIMAILIGKMDLFASMAETVHVDAAGINSQLIFLTKH